MEQVKIKCFLGEITEESLAQITQEEEQTAEEK